jgi:hypothetical protein
VVAVTAFAMAEDRNEHLTPFDGASKESAAGCPARSAFLGGQAD